MEESGTPASRGTPSGGCWRWGAGVGSVVKFARDLGSSGTGSSGACQNRCICTLRSSCWPPSQQRGEGRGFEAGPGAGGGAGGTPASPFPSPSSSPPPKLPPARPPTPSRPHPACFPSLFTRLLCIPCTGPRLVLPTPPLLLLLLLGCFCPPLCPELPTGPLQTAPGLFHLPGGPPSSCSLPAGPADLSGPGPGCRSQGPEGGHRPAPLMPRWAAAPAWREQACLAGLSPQASPSFWRPLLGSQPVSQTH